MLAMKAAQPAERWDEDFECQISRSPKQPSSPAAPARTSSPLSSLSWAESDTGEGPAAQIDRSFSGESAEGTEGENGTRVVRKRMKGAWDATAEVGESPEVEMASPTTLRRTLFPSAKPSQLSRPPVHQAFSFNSDDTFLPADTFAPPLLLPSPSLFNSSPDPRIPTEFPSHASSAYPPTLGISVSAPPDSAVTISEFLRGDGKPRRRLRKRSRVGEQPLSGGADFDSDDDMQADALAEPGSSPRQIISRGMSSLQRRFSVSKGKTPDGIPSSGARQPRSPPSPQAAFRRISGFMESRQPVGPAPLALQSTSAARRESLPVVASSPASASAAGLQRTPSQTYSVAGYHLPTRRGSGSTASSSSKPTSPRVRPKVIHAQSVPASTLMPPPPMPAASSSRPQPIHSQSAPRPSGSFQLFQFRSVSSSADMQPHEGGRPGSRASDRSAILKRGSPPRKGHRTSSSVNSIPLQTPPLYDKPLPSVIGSPFDPSTPLPPLPALPTHDLQRSVSTPSVNPSLVRRNSLSDLRIPPRVASAQKALREKVGVVKEFAMRVEDLKRLQERHAKVQLDLLVRTDARSTGSGRPVDRMALSSPHIPPSILRNNSDQRSVSNGSSSSLQIVEDRYAQWWEMAEVLVKLAGTGIDGPPPDTHRDSSSSVSSERARAITMLSRSSRVLEPPGTPPGMTAGPPTASPERWRGSTGRTDLSQRQLDVLKSMLTTPVSKSAIISSREYASALPASSPSFADLPPGAALSVPKNRMSGSSLPPQQRRSSRAGVKGLKDFLRSLKIGADYPADDIDGLEDARSSGTVTTAKSAAGTMASSVVVDPNVGSTATRKSPRRPSLASIFRFGKDGSGERRSKSKGSRSQASGSRTDVSHISGPGDDSDWERMSVDSVRPATPSGRTTPHSTYSGVVGPNRRRPTSPPPVPPLPPSTSLPARSAPPNPPAEWPSSRARPSDAPPPDDYSAIEITPENLQPLLLYVREVERNCAQCLRELGVQTRADGGAA